MFCENVSVSVPGKLWSVSADTNGTGGKPNEEISMGARPDGKYEGKDIIKHIHCVLIGSERVDELLKGRVDSGCKLDNSIL